MPHAITAPPIDFVVPRIVSTAVTRVRHIGRVPLAILLAAAVPAAGANAEIQPTTVKARACKLRTPAPEGSAISLMALPFPNRRNNTGVILVINCTDRRILSVRDVDHSPRHLRAQVFDEHRIQQLRGDRDQYDGSLNFNAEVMQSPFEHTIFAAGQGWSGPCDYQSLELTTSAADQRKDVQILPFGFNICDSFILLLLPPH